MEMVRLAVSCDRGDYHCRGDSCGCAHLGSVPGAASRLSCAGARYAVDWQRLVSAGATAQSTVVETKYLPEVRSKREESQVNTNTMSDYTVHTLVPSTSRGRYSLDDPVSGQDVTSGD